MDVNGFFERTIRFFLYLFILMLPFSSAVVEISISAVVVLWLIQSLFGLAVDRSVKPLWKTFFPSRTTAASAANLPIFLFLAVSVVSALFGQAPVYSLKAIFNKTAEWFAIFWFFAAYLNTRGRVLRALGLWAFSALVLSADAVFQYYHGTDVFRHFPLVRHGVTGTMGHPNDFGGYLAIVIPVLLGGAIAAARKGRRRLVLAVAVTLLVCLVALALTFSRGAWVGTLTAVLFVLFWFRRKLVVIFPGALLALFICFTLASHGRLIKDMRLNPANWNTAEWRFDVWRTSLDMIGKRPLLGQGTNTYMKAFERFYKSQDHGFFPYSPTYAHNCYIQVAAETGLLGLACFLWILVRLFRRIFQTVRAGPLDSDRLLLVGMSAGMIGFLVHVFFDTDLYSLQLSSLFWMLVGLVMGWIGTIQMQNNKKDA